MNIKVKHTYKVIRYYVDEKHPKHKSVILEKLSLVEARDWCHREETIDPGVWCDSFVAEIEKVDEPAVI